VHEEYGLQLTANPGNDYDAVIVTVPHQQYTGLTDEYFSSITKDKAMIADLKGMYKNKIHNRKYWSL
jgi:UDP-N-acetyl-D-glucosamine/UDP-N-acetyl-D-galactosamine dehydrogenase